MAGRATSTKISRRSSASPTGEPGIETISWLIDRIIQQRIVVVVAKEQNYIEVGKERLTLEQKKREKRLKYLQKLVFFFNIYFVLVLALLGSLGVGVFLGVNLPEGVVCSSRHSPCYHLRIRELKRVVK